MSNKVVAADKNNLNNTPSSFARIKKLVEENLSRNLSSSATFFGDALVALSNSKQFLPPPLLHCHLFVQIVALSSPLQLAHPQHLFIDTLWGIFFSVVHAATEERREAVLLLARAQYMSGNHRRALHTLHRHSLTTSHASCLQLVVQCHVSFIIHSQCSSKQNKPS